jgi:putative transcriptional regulator
LSATGHVSFFRYPQRISWRAALFQIHLRTGPQQTSSGCGFNGVLALVNLRSLLLRIHNEIVYISIMSLHNRIAVLRAEKKLSRAALASSVGVNPQTIGFLERGDYTPSLELAFKIAEHFGLPVEAVFSPRPFRTLSEQVYKLHKREA